MVGEVTARSVTSIVSPKVKPPIVFVGAAAMETCRNDGALAPKSISPVPAAPGAPSSRVPESMVTPPVKELVASRATVPAPLMTMVPEPMPVPSPEGMARPSRIHRR